MRVPFCIRWSFLLTFDFSSAVCQEYLPICAVFVHCDAIKIKKIMRNKGNLYYSSEIMFLLCNAKQTNVMFLFVSIIFQWSHP